MDKQIQFEEGYKYQLHRTITAQLDIFGFTVFNEFYCLTVDGILSIKQGYAWDGPSGPCPDWKCFMRGSLVHDVLYQMMRMKELPQTCFHPANLEFKKIVLEDSKAWQKPMAQIVYLAVEKFGRKFAEVQPDIILTAP